MQHTACRHRHHGTRITCHAQVLTEMKLLKPVAEYASHEYDQSDAPKQLEKTLQKALCDAGIITDGAHRFPG